jgi:hypothetical protein
MPVVRRLVSIARRTGSVILCGGRMAVFLELKITAMAQVSTLRQYATLSFHRGDNLAELKRALHTLTNGAHGFSLRSTSGGISLN